MSVRIVDRGARNRASTGGSSFLGEEGRGEEGKDKGQLSESYFRTTTKSSTSSWEDQPGNLLPEVGSRT